jgi:hypothetical protein
MGLWVYATSDGVGWGGEIARLVDVPVTAGLRLLRRGEPCPSSESDRTSFPRGEPDNRQPRALAGMVACACRLRQIAPVRRGWPHIRRLQPFTHVPSSYDASIALWGGTWIQQQRSVS